MRGEIAGAGGPKHSDNLIILPGVRGIVPAADVERLIAAAKQIEGVALHAEAVKRALPLGVPSSVTANLADIIARIETLATLVEEPALTAQGLIDVA